MTALMIARITVKDPAKFREYLARTREIAAPYGAELLYQGKVARTLNGGGDHEMAVVVRFPDAKAIDAWFDSEEYRPLQALRDAGTDMHMTSYSALS